MRETPYPPVLKGASQLMMTFVELSTVQGTVRIFEGTPAASILVEELKEPHP